jgi:hypothetical protein
METKPLEFMECDACRSKAGTPPLCTGCFHNRSVIQKLGNIDQHKERIFEILNCFEVDARNIQNGMTYLDSSDANRLSRSILQTIKENT